MKLGISRLAGRRSQKVSAGFFSAQFRICSSRADEKLNQADQLRNFGAKYGLPYVKIVIMASNAPIGVFDSGLGGVSVLREAVRILPHENFIYFGDDANAPYGSRSESEIRLLTLSSTDFLASRNVKAIVIACNTATSVGINYLRSRYDFPVISIEPAVKLASDAFPSGTIAVLATPATLHQDRFHALVDRLGVRERVRMIECSELARLIETGELDSPELRGYIKERLECLEDESDVNALVLGCTHYTFAAPIIEAEAVRMLRGLCRICDGAAGTARQLRRVLQDGELLSDRTEIGTVAFTSSAGPAAVQKMKDFFFIKNIA